MRVSVDMVDAPRRSHGREGEHVGIGFPERGVDAVLACPLPIARSGPEVSGIIEFTGRAYEPLLLRKGDKTGVNLREDPNAPPKPAAAAPGPKEVAQ